MMYVNDKDKSVTRKKETEKKVKVKKSNYQQLNSILSSCNKKYRMVTPKTCVFENFGPILKSRKCF